MPPLIVSQVCDTYDFDACPSCEEIKTTKGTEQLFLKSASVWINKPHVVNRRLCGSKIIEVVRVSNKGYAVATVDKFWSYYTKEKKVDVDADNGINFTDLVDESAAFVVIVRELIPKSEFFPKYLEAVVYDKQEAKLTFIPIGQDVSEKAEDPRPTSELQYQLELIGQELTEANVIKLSWLCDHTDSDQPRRQITSKWLRSTLLEKLVNWSEVSNISTSITSLQLVAVDKYKDTYTRLKNKYGRDLVKNWTECTDPKKFVYEDVAIAAYLLLIWEQDSKEKNLQHKQSFVDLGCGNGLLVYILTREGHKGCGFDLRKRKIWDTFGSDIDLREEAITPSADHLYPEFDWVIGNHSDELTPWIPVIAARSSYKTCFFLLPCCAHDFDCKFGAVETGKSRYGSYINYVREITVNCGFQPESDTLRIPSTKRVCIIGRRRSYEQKNELLADQRRQAFIDKRTIYNRCLNNGAKRQASKQEDPSYDQYANMHTSLPTDRIVDISQVSIKNTHVMAQNSFKTPQQEEQHSEVPGCGSPNTEAAIASSTPVSSQDSSSGDSFSFNAGDKRTHQSLDSIDSGFNEMDYSDLDEQEHAASKRSRNTCSPEDLEAVNGLDSCQIDDTPISSQDLNIILKINPVVKSQKWVKNFQPRVEPGVRNCQTVPEEVKLEIVRKVFEKVLSSPTSENSPISKDVLLINGKTWSKGGSVSLGEVAALFDRCVMQELKSEFGGLQTLLRNHSHVFQVTGGFVQLRDFTAADPWVGRNLKKGKGKRDSKLDTRKTTLCWFYANHPDGCPRTSEMCQFAHGIEELRTKPQQRETNVNLLKPMQN
jgi:hypothetical protein